MLRPLVVAIVLGGAALLYSVHGSPIAEAGCQNQICVWTDLYECYGCYGEAGFGCEVAAGNCAQCTESKCPKEDGGAGEVAFTLWPARNAGGCVSPGTALTGLSLAPGRVDVRLLDQAGGPLELTRGHFQRSHLAAGVVESRSGKSITAYEIARIGIFRDGRSSISRGALVVVREPLRRNQVAEVPEQRLPDLFTQSGVALVGFFVNRVRYVDGTGWDANQRALVESMKQALSRTAKATSLN